MRLEIVPRLVLRWDGMMRGFIVGPLEVFWWPRTRMWGAHRGPRAAILNLGPLEITWVHRRARG